MGGVKRLTPPTFKENSAQHHGLRRKYVLPLSAESGRTYFRTGLLAMGQILDNTLILAFVKHLWKLFFFLLYRSTFFAWGENKNQ